MTEQTPDQQGQEQTAAEQSDTQKRRAAYSAAEARLREAHNDEFRQLVQEEASNRGVTYSFRKSEEERAAEQMQQLLSQHPNLREQVLGQPGDTPPTAPPA